MKDSPIASRLFELLRMVMAKKTKVEMKHDHAAGATSLARTASTTCLDDQM